MLCLRRYCAMFVWAWMFRFRSSRRSRCSWWYLGFSVTRLSDFWTFLVEKMSYNSSPNGWRLFWLLRKYRFSSKKYSGYFLGNFLKIYGYFLLQHLVTLLGIQIIKWKSSVPRFANISPLWQNFIRISSFLLVHKVFGKHCEPSLANIVCLAVNFQSWIKPNIEQII